MTFNIRYGTAKDGENHWTRAPRISLRRHSRAERGSHWPPGSARVSDRRDPGRGTRLRRRWRRTRRCGEGGGVFGDPVPQGSLSVAEAGTFWFSDTPSVPGSKSWGNNITRICTWARFIDADGRGFYHFNLHLDHQSQPSRERSALLLKQRIEARAFSAEPVIVTGDFNVGERNPALTSLVGGEPGAAGSVRRHVRVRYPDAADSGHVHRVQVRRHHWRQDRLRARPAWHRGHERRHHSNQPQQPLPVRPLSRGCTRPAGAVKPLQNRQGA